MTNRRGADRIVAGALAPALMLALAFLAPVQAADEALSRSTEPEMRLPLKFGTAPGADGRTVPARLPATHVLVCDERDIDYSDSKYPRTVCTKAHVEPVSAPAPVPDTARVCVNETVDYSDSKYPTRTCNAWGVVARPAAREPRVEVFQAWDYRRESPQYEIHPIAIPAGH